MDYDGILLIDKPKGWTSHDVVAKVRGILKAEIGHKVKVGHTGTLDPEATGLMIVVVGSYCKRAEQFSKLDKTYEVTMKLGETSSTGDEEGDKTIVSSEEPTKIIVNDAIASFTRTYDQLPPVYSAIKINGQRAYKLARAGVKVEMKTRQVTIYETKLTDYSYPFVQFSAKVSSGTYIRSLAEDIGQKLNTGAYMAGLRRAQVGEYKITQAHTITEFADKSSPSGVLIKP